MTIPSISLGKRVPVRKQMSTSFMDPFNLTIDVTEELDEDNQEDDPTFHITLGGEKLKNWRTEQGQTLYFGRKMMVTMKVRVIGPGISKVSTADDVGTLLDDICALVFIHQLKHLENLNVDGNCVVKGCKLGIQIKLDKVVSGYVEIPMLNTNERFHSGDLLITSAVLLSGNNFIKMQLFAKLTKLHFPSKSSFNRIQTTYLVHK
ncbi:uncharacterized protein LOC132565318 [Ylistrum balloti]|uniref:uncharacterized protein LOC132565318 n=1 Tax=Ylistrum balloti TaxID=509963 RepID=UPI002905D4C7|nr:uncharacterized protein LOC132565318 [Ylistrum balloti]